MYNVGMAGITRLINVLSVGSFLNVIVWNGQLSIREAAFEIQLARDL